MSIHRVVLQLAAASAFCALGPAACAGTATSHASGDAATAQEQRAVDGLALKKRYPDIVTGTDVKGSTLMIYVDVDKLYSMDEDSENAMRAQLLKSWKGIWSAAHRGEHATVRTSLRDYYGSQVLSDAARV
ncbi:MAG TPA: hypothetical protein VFE17_03630 [Candidatus Baltobacteraceae bacterium]|jgi:hypothetical protein|nr:hypothetical protein [Candidatus Baltobacteraceae bacterium]